MDSFLHRLDPRTKILCLFGYMAGIFLVKSGGTMGCVALFSIMITLLSGVPFLQIVKGLKPLCLLLFLTLVLNLLMTPTGEVLWRWGVFKVTDDGIERGIFLVVRLVLLLNVTSLLTLTTTPILLTDGLEHLMKRCFIPMAHELAMMMTIALRFIPTLIEETERIMQAQTARGADFSSGNLIEKGKNLIPLLIPLFVSALRRADDLALAMETRCYRGGQGRTRLRQLRYGFRDAVAMLVTAGFVTFVAADRFILQIFG